ncbi:MAG: phosphatase PAP2 family protein [Candidatus Aenigmatarchaeota archaeon]
MFQWQLLNAAEAPIMQFFVSMRNPVLNTIAMGYTQLGHAVLGAVLFLIFYAFKEKVFAGRLFIGLVLGNLTVASLKLFFGRLLPYHYALLSSPKFLLKYCFPSGHTMTAFVLAHVLGERFGKKGMFYLFAVGVGLSRIYLGVHYPSDVIVGALIGILIGKLAMSRHAKSFLKRVSGAKDFIYSKF